MIKIDLSYFDKKLENKILNSQLKVSEIHMMIHDKSGKGGDFLGWVDIPKDNWCDECDKIVKVSEKIKNESDCLVVIGIGGSYLGTKAGLSFLANHFQKTEVEILFAGHNMSSDYLYGLINYLKDKDFSLHVISKSGTTTEPAIAFRLLKESLVDKYGIKEAHQRIYVTTDKEKGALYNEAINNGYERFVIPEDVGGRFSVLTSVGLLPFAVAGYDIKQLLKGANDAYSKYLCDDLNKNESYLYGLLRYLMYEDGKKIELLANYDLSLNYLSEWWKQLFGESEGKDNKGLFVSSVSFTTDLHSLGQYIQEGERHIFETILSVDSSNHKVKIPYNNENLDGLNYIANKTIDEVNDKARDGTMIAHYSGGVPNIVIQIPKKDEYTLGYLFYFFEKACAMSAYLLGVNPFNQPGVEEYKRNMFKLLGKKGY